MNYGFAWQSKHKGLLLQDVKGQNIKQVNYMLMMNLNVEFYFKPILLYSQKTAACSLNFVSWWWACLHSCEKKVRKKITFHHRYFSKKTRIFCEKIKFKTSCKPKQWHFLFHSVLTICFNIRTGHFSLPPDQGTCTRTRTLQSSSPPPHSSSLLLSIPSNKPIAESLCSSTPRRTSVSELTRERNRDGAWDRQSGREESKEKERATGFSRSFFRGNPKKRKMRQMYRVCFIYCKKKAGEARLSMPLLFFCLFIPRPITLSFFRQHWRHNVAWMSAPPPPDTIQPSHSAEFQNRVTAASPSRCFLLNRPPISGLLTSAPQVFHPSSAVLHLWRSAPLFGRDVCSSPLLMWCSVSKAMKPLSPGYIVMLVGCLFVSHLFVFHQQRMNASLNNNWNIVQSTGPSKMTQLWSAWWRAASRAFQMNIYISNEMKISNIRILFILVLDCHRDVTHMKQWNLLSHSTCVASFRPRITMRP